MALNVSLWTKVAIAVQSALAAADTITAITKANPGVVSAAAHGISNGEYVLLSIQGMYQLDNRVVRVVNVTVGTFELDGVNTTLFDTFTSGTAEVITFGTTLAATIGLSAGGGGFRMENVTTIHDDRDVEIPGNAAPISYTLDNIWDVADAGLIALKYASDNKLKRAMRITFSNGQKVVFTGYVAANLAPGGSAPGKVTAQAVITMHGAPTTYAT